MDLFLLSKLVGSLHDQKAAADLIKEAGGRLLHLVSPILHFPGGWVVECPADVGQDLGLMPWS